MITAALISLVVAQSGPSLGQGRSFMKSLYDGKASSAWAQGGSGLKAQMGSEAGLAAFGKRIAGSFGTELRVVSEGLVNRGALTIYRRVAMFSNWARGAEIEVAFDDSGRVMNVQAKPAATPAPTAYGAKKTTAKLRLPVEGPWLVLWGGRTWDDNRHAAVTDMRYAIDLLIGQHSYINNGTKNSDYLCWNKNVVAPADGVVVVAVDGVTDNEPNRIALGSLYGNYLVVDHGTGEFSLMGHLQQGSVGVKVGDRVSSGQVLARVGSSGMSTEPHLHYQLMDKGDYLLANGLPPQFRNYLRDGKLISRGELRRNEVVEQPASVASR